MMFVSVMHGLACGWQDYSYLVERYSDLGQKRLSLQTKALGPLVTQQLISGLVVSLRVCLSLLQNVANRVLQLHQAAGDAAAGRQPWDWRISRTVTLPFCQSPGLHVPPLLPTHPVRQLPLVGERALPEAAVLGAFTVLPGRPQHTTGPSTVAGLRQQAAAAAPRQPVQLQQLLSQLPAPACCQLKASVGPSKRNQQKCRAAEQRCRKTSVESCLPQSSIPREFHQIPAFA